MAKPVKKPEPVAVPPPPEETEELDVDDEIPEQEEPESEVAKIGTDVATTPIEPGPMEKVAAANKEAAQSQPVKHKVAVALDRLGKAYKFLKPLKETQWKDLKIHKVHYEMMMELGKLQEEGKLKHLSDGSCETIGINYNKLVKAQKIRE